MSSLWHNTYSTTTFFFHTHFLLVSLPLRAKYEADPTTHTVASKTVHMFCIFFLFLSLQKQKHPIVTHITVVKTLDADVHCNKFVDC